MGTTKYEWTDKTGTGLSKEEYDALWTAVNAIPATYALDDISDVVITAVGDHDLLAWDAGTSKWINMTPVEAGLSLTYLPLAGGIMTGDLRNLSRAIPLQLSYAGGPKIQLLDSTSNDYTRIEQTGGDYLTFSWNAVAHSRFRDSDNAWELSIATTQPTGLLTNVVSFYQDAAVDQLWATWTDSGATHHAMVSRARRTIVSLAPGAASRTSGALSVVIGAFTDVAAVQFPDATTNSAVWTFMRPADWDYGKIQITVFWTNYDSDVTGNHYWFPRLLGCADAEHLGSTQTCNALISGAQTTAGLNNSSKIGNTQLAMGSSADLTGETIFYWRMQRQGGHGSDTSGASWEVIGVKAELIATV